MHDVIVVGLGAMGSAAAQHLAERGQRVLGLEQFAPLHALGSSHGNSRMIRQSYWEHAAYVPLLLRAYELWERLERETARTASADAADLMRLHGGLVIGACDEPEGLVARSRLAAEEHGLAHEILAAAELRRRFPQMRATDGTCALFEARAGYLRAAHCLRAQIAAATAHGAELHFHEPVLDWRSLADGSVEVTTTSASYRAERLVLTAGPWAARVAGDATRERGSALAGAGLPLTVTRQILYWFEPAVQAELFTEASCPVYIFEPPDRADPSVTPVLYGFPETPDDPGTVKVALHGSRDVVAPEALDTPAEPGSSGPTSGVDRIVHAHEVEHMRERLASTLPPLATGRLARAETCLYTMTPDEHFLVDLHPANQNVSVAAGFSGHGFKFANLIGEILADLSLTGRTAQPIDLFGVARFDGAPVRS